MTRWQYYVVNLGAFKQMDRLVNALGHLGSEGWELVTVYDKASNWFMDFEKGFLLFRRAVLPGADPAGPWATASFADDIGRPATAPPDQGIPY